MAQALTEVVLQYVVDRDPVRESAGVPDPEPEPVGLPEALLLFPPAGCSSCIRSSRRAGERNSMVSNQRAGEL